MRHFLSERPMMTELLRVPRTKALLDASHKLYKNDRADICVACQSLRGAARIIDVEVGAVDVSEMTSLTL